jgi:hypothetical protein
LVGGFFLLFNVMVNCGVGFLFDIGAFGESLFECPKSNPRVPLRSSGQAKRASNTHRSAGCWKASAQQSELSLCLMHYDYNPSLIMQSFTTGWLM